MIRIEVDLKPDGRGFALPLLLYLLLALTLLAQGTLLLARREAASSRAFLHATRSGLAAESAVQLLSDGHFETSPFRFPGAVVPLDSEWDLDGIWRGGLLRWLTQEYFLVEGIGRSRGWSGEQKVGVLGWSLDPVERVAEFRSGVEVGGQIVGRQPIGTPSSVITAVPRGWNLADCTPYTRVLDSLFGSSSLPLIGRPPSVSGIDPTRISRIPPLGFLTGSILLARAKGAEVRTVLDSLRVHGGGCSGGDPPIFLASEGSLHLSDDRFCGLVAVGGNLTLSGEGEFKGLALVGGGLLLQGNSVFEGIARVEGSLITEPSASFVVAGCPTLRALSGIPVLTEPVLLQGGIRLGGLP